MHTTQATITSSYVEPPVSCRQCHVQTRRLVQELKRWNCPHDGPPERGGHRLQTGVAHRRQQVGGMLGQNPKSDHVPCDEVLVDPYVHMSFCLRTLNVTAVGEVGGVPQAVEVAAETTDSVSDCAEVSLQVERSETVLLLVYRVCGCQHVSKFR
ncbi:hypothetical protein OE88DRAFT_1484881 [Heliocybe sulcata]|uniref:Uncharacterized protein n=1 Tax=Heliocybe sulcata TaxID=5364 RepID=A0A5C3N3U9_9AGAM|nr:hypothetical protein OE88DRAFT_1484881 [Heliocybe sulcata]